MKKENISIEPFVNEDAKRAASVEVFRNIYEVLFFYLEEDQENLEDDGELEVFTDLLWTMTTAALSCTGINIIGRDSDGKLIAKLEPTVSVKEFLIKEDIGEEEYVFYEDHLDPIGPDSGFGRHDDKIMKM